MAINTSNINTGGAVVTVGGVVPIAQAPDANGYYWGTVSGVDVGCTTGGVSVTYSFEKTDIFCDQTLAAVETAITSETAEVTFSMLESDAENLKIGIQQATYLAVGGDANYVGVGGITGITFVPLKLEVTDVDTGNLTTWTFFRVLSGGIEINFERDNPTQVNVTFTAFADTTKPAGQQLFTIHEDVTP